MEPLNLAIPTFLETWRIQYLDWIATIQIAMLHPAFLFFPCKSLHDLERLLKVGNDIVDMLDAHGYTDQVGRHT